MTDAVSSYGITLGRWDGISAYTTIVNNVNINPPAMTAAEHEATDHTGSAGWQEWITSVKSLESFTIEINWEPSETGHAQLTTDLIAGTVEGYRLTFPTSPAVTWTFDAMVTSFQPSGADARGGGGVLTAEVTFRPTGTPVLA